EADLAGRGPRDHGTGRVGDRDDRVVEGALDVRLSVRDVLAFLAADLLGGRGSGSSLRWHKRVRSVMSDCRAAGSWSVVPAGPPDADRTATPLRGVCGGLAPGGSSFSPGFFLPATVRLGPLRVRALARVRWPRTGRPLRWRMPS